MPWGRSWVFAQNASVLPSDENVGGYENQPEANSGSSPRAKRVVLPVMRSTRYTRWVPSRLRFHDTNAANRPLAEMTPCVPPALAEASAPESLLVLLRSSLTNRSVAPLVSPSTRLVAS